MPSAGPARRLLAHAALRRPAELEGAFNLLTALVLYAWEKDEEKRAEVLAKLSAAVSKEQSGSGFDRAGAKYRM